MISRIEAKLTRISQAVFFFLVWTLKFLVFSPFLKIRVEGKSNIPIRGRYILAANHQNFFDGFFLAYPTGPLKNVRFVIAKRALKLKSYRLLAVLIGSVLIGSETEEYQRALKRLNKILTHGSCIGIFPEGDVSSRKVPRRFKGGVAKLSLDSKTKVIPVYIHGTYNLRYFKYWLSRPEILIKIGKPVDLYNYAKDGNNLEQMAAILREKIIDLMDVKEIKEFERIKEFTNSNSFDKTLTVKAYNLEQRESIIEAL